MWWCPDRPEIRMIASGAFQDIARAGLAFGSAFGLTFFLTPVVRSTAVRFGLIAKPVEDRWGRRVIARLGGVAMYVGFMTSVLCWVPLGPTVIGLVLGSTLVFGLGLLDDLRRVPPYTKLVVQLLIGAIVVGSGIRISLIQWNWVAIPLSILWFVLVMNAFNLLDNMDGLAAGIGALAAAFCAWHAGVEWQGAVVSIAAVLVGICLAFLRFNFPPAKIYMGDAGSHLLGLNLAALALMGSWRHSTRLLTVLAVPTLVLAVPIFDTCFVTAQRLLHRQHPFVGGTDHVSHRLAILGLSVRQTVLLLYSVSVAFGLLSVMTAGLKPLSLAALWVFVLTGLVLFGRYLAKVNVYRLESRPAGSGTAAVSNVATTYVETMLLHKRRLIEVVVDFCLLSCVYVFAHLLRFEGILTPDLQRLIVKSLPTVLVLKLACFMSYGLYRGVWRYMGVADLITVFKAVTLSSILSAVALLYFWHFEGFSRAVLIIDWMLTFLAIGGARVIERVLDEWISGLSLKGAPVVIVGAGDIGVRVLRLLREHEPSAFRVIGFLDDDMNKQGARIHGFPVLGSRGRLAELIQTQHVREVLVAISDPPGELLQYIQQCCERQGVTWKVVTAGVMHTL